LRETNNYTLEQTQQIITLYQELGNDGLPKIAETIGKTINSIRAKLVKEGVYCPPEKTALRKRQGLSKKEILRDLEELGLQPDGLEGATKNALENIRNLIASFKTE
jgi:hypothetical protein